MEQRPIDLVALAKDYGDRWVALDPEERTVIASGDSAKEVLEAAESTGVDLPLVLHVARDYGTLAP